MSGSELRAAWDAALARAGEIWGWNAVNPGAPSVPRPAGRLPERAVVRPDDSVILTNDSWAALFIEESGL